MGLLIAGVVSLITDSLSNPRAHSQYELLQAFSVFASVLLLVAYAFWIRAEWRDPRRGTPYAIYLILSMLLFIASYTGSAAYARVVVSGETPEAAVRAAFASTLTQPLTSCHMIIPFLLLAFSAAPMSRVRAAGAGAVLFIAGGILFAWMYLSGHLDSQAALLQRKWTASALAMAFVFVESVVVGAVLFLISSKVVKNRKSNDT